MELDEDGFDNRDVDVAEQLARKEGLEDLSGEHWKLITALRLHYERHGESPLCRDILTEAGCTKMDMYRLFPSLGYRSAYKLAGCRSPMNVKPIKSFFCLKAEASDFLVQA
ncbi:MAG TPA: sulfurtransferase TusE [Nitrospiraceae bacterium]|nr:sulfurtransferase TusE [Nitrospiraceae bacterium]